MNYPKVIYLGGSPMVGKTTIGRIIASRLRYACFSTDDLGAAIASVTEPAAHRAFHYMGGRDHREYYIATDPDQLIRDIDDQHEALWPALQTLFRTHSTWGAPAVIEGWALRPTRVRRLSGDIAGVFLLADDALIERRVRRSDFSEGASDRELMVQRYLERSLRYNACLREQLVRDDLKAIPVSSAMSAEGIADACLLLLAQDAAP